MSEPNPAIVPDPVEPEPRQYEVLGQHAVLGHEPGEKFTAALDPEQEERMLARGSLRPVEKPAPKSKARKGTNNGTPGGVD